MAHKNKVSAKLKNRFLNDIEKDKRKINFKNLRKYFVIVCEGEKTEPNYFKSFKKLLPTNTIQMKIVGAADNTINIVDIAYDFANEIRKTHGVDCEAWAVFDKDSFPNQDFDNAIHRGIAIDVNCAYSNEAFELWYILHFAFHQNATSRNDYKGLLTNYLKRKYQKNDSNMYYLLLKMGNQVNAIKFAKKLQEIHSSNTPSNSNPCTTVFRLVEELNKFITE